MASSARDVVRESLDSVGKLVEAYSKMLEGVDDGDPRFLAILVDLATVFGVAHIVFSELVKELAGRRGHVGS